MPTTTHTLNNASSASFFAEPQAPNVKFGEVPFSTLSCISVEDAAEGDNRSREDAVLTMLSDKFILLMFSCVQLASKLTHHLSVSMAVAFLKSVGHSCSKGTLLESELLVLKTLDFSINFPNPLMYVETLLEVLEYNAAVAPVTHLYALSQRVLQFIFLQRTAIYNSLLVAATACQSPSLEVNFVCVREDYMLLSVGVIAAAAFVLNLSTWEKVVQELSDVTGISPQSISDFVRVTVLHIARTEGAFKTA
uniref:Cyclin N-terminal domain-containing protein n=1 Tax=Scleropages formosus TaxID=113540 RepID=A0A8C9WL18_SCLFO